MKISLKALRNYHKGEITQGTIIKYGKKNKRISGYHYENNSIMLRLSPVL